MTKRINRAAKAALACYSFRGNDFDRVGSGLGRDASWRTRLNIRYEKRVTVRANRRANKAFCAE